MRYAVLIATAMADGRKMKMPRIYDSVKVVAGFYNYRLPRHWRGIVRNTLQRHCRASRKYTKPNLFIHHDRGVWSLYNAKSRRSR